MLRLSVIVGFVLVSANAISAKVPLTTRIVSKRTRLAAGSELYLLCVVNGYPKPEVIWYKDFERISSDDRITVEENELLVSRANTNDTGVYSCLALNIYYSHYSRVQIIVKEPTESNISSTTGSKTDNGAQIIITDFLGTLKSLDTSSTSEPPTAIIISEDTWLASSSEINLLCTVNGYPVPEVYWYRRNKRISSDDRITVAENRLTVSRANIHDSDWYVCHAFNAFKTVWSLKRIFVNDSRIGGTEDREKSITENKFTTTETTASDISSTTESTTDNGASIITEDLGISDHLETSSTGDYWWGETEDREKSITENEFTTTETTESDISSTTESTTDNGASIITEDLGISDHLDTSSTGGCTDSTTAESSTNYSFESSATESDESGTTRYTETTEIRESSMSPVPVTTHIVSERTLLAPGSELNLLCEVDGYPLPEVSWFKDFALISSDDRITVAETHLTVYGANSNDTGVYSCHAFNALNSHYSSLQINVERLLLPPTCEDYPYMSNCNLIVRSKICYNKLFSNFCCKSCVEAGQLDAWSQNATAGRRHA